MQVKTAILNALQDNGTPMTFSELKKKVKKLKPDKTTMFDISQTLEDLINQREVVYLPSKMQFSRRG